MQTGYIDSGGHPRIRIRVSGTNPGVHIDLEALIDTGFTGFLMLPLTQAFSLGLVLIGTGDYMLADGSTVTNFLVKGTVQIDSADFETDERLEGVIVLAGDESLIGMEFLRTLNKSLVIDSTMVALVDESVESLLTKQF